MKEYIVQSKNSSHFRLLSDEMEIGKLIYKNWTTFKAEILLDEAKTYQLEPKGFWSTMITLKQDGKVFLNYKMRWNGEFLFKCYFDEVEQEFNFKQKGFFKTSYTLLDKEKQKLLVIEPRFKWRNFNYDYKISASEDFENFNFKQLLVLTAIHCVNYYMMMTMIIASSIGSALSRASIS